MLHECFIRKNLSNIIRQTKNTKIRREYLYEEKTKKKHTSEDQPLFH